MGACPELKETPPMTVPDSPPTESLAVPSLKEYPCSNAKPNQTSRMQQNKKGCWKSNVCNIQIKCSVVKTTHTRTFTHKTLSSPASTIAKNGTIDIASAVAFKHSAANYNLAEFNILDYFSGLQALLQQHCYHRQRSPAQLAAPGSTAALHA